MATVQLYDGEHFESLFKRFRKVVQDEKILKELRQRRFFEKPSQDRKRKAAKKRIKSRRTTAKDLMRRF
jgi:small subunit ribosomal protein S21